MSVHRYVLRRDWLVGDGVLNMIMLNPSTANDTIDDPTIRRCVGFAKRWGYSGLAVTNLFAFRATNPTDLREHAKVDYALTVGIENDGHLIREARLAALVVCAWGDWGEIYGRDRDVMNRVLPDHTLGRIGQTKSGNPLHPCRTAYTNMPEIFRLAAVAT
jgi:hypothetical protein